MLAWKHKRRQTTVRGLVLVLGNVILRTLQSARFLPLTWCRNTKADKASTRKNMTARITRYCAGAVVVET